MNYFEDRHESGSDYQTSHVSSTSGQSLETLLCKHTSVDFHLFIAQMNIVTLKNHHSEGNNLKQLEEYPCLKFLIKLIQKRCCRVIRRHMAPDGNLFNREKCV